MIKTVTICDICGKEVEFVYPFKERLANVFNADNPPETEKTPKLFVPIGLITIPGKIHPAAKGVIVYDICIDCAAKLDNAIRKKIKELNPKKHKTGNAKKFGIIPDML